MKARTYLMVAAILTVLAYLIFGPIRRQFGDDARTVSTRPAAADQPEAMAVPQVAESQVSSEPRLSVESRDSAAFVGEEQLATSAMPSVEWRAIEFDNDSTTIAPAEIAKLSDVVKIYRSGSARRIVMITDQSDQTQLLKDRIAAVRRHMIADGMPAWAIDTIDGKPSQKNVIIVIADIEMTDRRDAAAAASPP